MSGEINATWKELIQRIQELPEKQQKKVLRTLLEELRQIEQAGRASGAVDIPLESKNLKIDANATAKIFHKPTWARGQLEKALKKHGTIQKALQNISGEVLAYLDAFAMDLIEKRFKGERLEAIRKNIHERKREQWKEKHPNCPEGWVDFAREDVPRELMETIHPNAISKSLKKMVEEPFYVRKRSPQAFGRGLSLDAPKQKSKKVFKVGLSGLEEAGEDEA